MQPFIPSKLPVGEIIWEPLIPSISRANRALAHYQGVLYSVPNAELLLSPLTTNEAVFSSRIEGTEATLREVFGFEAGDEPGAIEKRRDIDEILNYRRALLEAENWLATKPFTLNLLLRLHDILLDSVRGQDKARGQFRKMQNYIAPVGAPIEKAAFIPPSPLILMEHLDNWEKYYHQNAPDPLVQLAVIHAQFEILHPFLDGNGRLGRIIIPLFLFEKKLLNRPTFYLSEWLEERRDQYVHALRDLGRTQGAWNRWIEFFLTGVEEQAEINSTKGRAIADLYDRTLKKVVDLTRSQHATALLEQLFNRPIFQASQLTFKTSLTRATKMRLIRTLETAGIIKAIKKSSGRRAAIYAFQKLLDTCEGKIGSRR